LGLGVGALFRGAVVGGLLMEEEDGAQALVLEGYVLQQARGLGIEGVLAEVRRIVRG